MQEELEELIKRHGAAKFIITAWRAMKEEQDMRRTTHTEDIALRILSQCKDIMERELKEQRESEEE
ncbi:hypothetical protein Ea92_15 [Erwinia phage Ea9-2]|uniref:Uncharacterized protein n=1 Tax=Erwinia phage Ea9-2 TaxID=1429767 RepID=W6AR14_9CAUD|nr:hypothetical protein Ea92_15 [Erwinia phage Ea9-2]AHI60072.1 hypothetical protein Ea92_15 [Erwinia phage Ea9-2]